MPMMLGGLGSLKKTPCCKACDDHGSGSHDKLGDAYPATATAASFPSGTFYAVPVPAGGAAPVTTTGLVPPGALGPYKTTNLVLVIAALTSNNPGKALALYDADSGIPSALIPGTGTAAAGPGIFHYVPQDTGASPFALTLAQQQADCVKQSGTWSTSTDAAGNVVGLCQPGIQASPNPLATQCATAGGSWNTTTDAQGNVTGNCVMPTAPASSTGGWVLGVGAVVLLGGIAYLAMQKPAKRAPRRAAA